jgi:hypothetical protein
VHPATTNGKKRGRPAKAADAEDDATEPPKKRGRPAKDTPAVPKAEIAPPKKRGRPPKGGETTKIEADDGAAAEQLEEELVEEVEAETTAEAAPDTGAASKPTASSTTLPKKRGRPPKKGKRQATSKAAPSTGMTDGAVDIPEEEEEAEADDEEEVEVSDGTNYWLMKAEQQGQEQTLEDGTIVSLSVMHFCGCTNNEVVQHQIHDRRPSRQGRP